MIGPTSVDSRTTTPADAATFERLRGGSYGADPHALTANDLGDDAAMDADIQRRRTQRAEQARERGEYVPSDAMSLVVAACQIGLDQRGVRDVDVVATRDGVLRVSGSPAAPVVVDALQDMYGATVEVAMTDGAVWVRFARQPLADPLATAATETSPF